MEMPKFKITRDTDDSPEADARLAEQIATTKLESDAPGWKIFRTLDGMVSADQINPIMDKLRIATDLCASRFEVIHSLQAEIMCRDTELDNLRQQIKHLEELNTAQSEKIRFWKDMAEKSEVERSEAIENTMELRVSAIRVEGERNALDMVVEKLLNRLEERAEQ